MNTTNKPVLVVGGLNAVIADGMKKQSARQIAFESWSVHDDQVQSDKLNDYGNFIVVTCQRELTLQDKARLNAIAALPDLIAALQQVLNASEDNGDMEDIDWGGIRAALEKAGCL